MKKLNLILIIFVLFTAACKKDDPKPNAPDELGKGIFIVNEGNFNSGNASLTYFETETKTTTNLLFYNQNNTPLGDVAQSISLLGEKVFIVVNNSGLIYIVDRKTAKYEGKLTGLVSPRQLLFVDERKAFVSDLSSSKLTIIDPVELNVLGKIELGRTSEEMLKIGDEVFVANWSAYNQSKKNNQLLIVNILQDILVDSITVGIEPNSMVTDKNGMLWVLCSGGFDKSEKASLWQINPAERKVIQTIYFPDSSSSPSSLEINREGDRLYFINAAVFRMKITDAQVPAEAFIQGFADLPYQLAVHPSTNEIYLTDAVDYSRNGFVFHFDASGQILDTISAGIIPGAIGFSD